MRRIFLATLLASLAAILLLVPATGATRSSAKLRGTVAAMFPDNGLIRVDTRRSANILRVAGSQARIRTGQRVELRGSTLRQHGHGSRVLARNVTIARSVALRSSSPVTGGSLAPLDDDELEVKGTITSLSPLTVTNSSGSAVCAVPAGTSLTGFAVGDFVEMTCDRVGGVWTLRELEHEDDDELDEDEDDNSGPGNADDDDDDDDNSGPGNGDDEDEDDNSGHGNGDDDDDDDGED